METTPTPPCIQPNGTQKLWSVLSHLACLIGLGIIFPLIVYLVMRKEDEYVRANSASALNFQLSLLIYAIVCIPFVWLLIGIPMLILLSIAGIILAIIAAVKASDGTCYKYPLTIPFVR